MHHSNFYGFMEDDPQITQSHQEMYHINQPIEHPTRLVADAGPSIHTTMMRPQDPLFQDNLHESSYSGNHPTIDNAGDTNPTSRINKGNTDFTRRKNWSERIIVEMTGLIYVLSPLGKILYCSESTTDLTGYRPHEMVGQSLTDFLHVDDLDVFFRDFNMAFETRSQIKAYYRIRKKDETFGIFELVGQPKSDAPGEAPKSFFGIAQPMPTKNGMLVDSFLELKMENEWLRWRIDELQSEDSIGELDTFAPLTETEDINSGKMEPGLDENNIGTYVLKDEVEEWDINGQDMEGSPDEYARILHAISKSDPIDTSDMGLNDRAKRRVSSNIGFIVRFGISYAALFTLNGARGRMDQKRRWIRRSCKHHNNPF
ncbi:putative white collar 2 protein [Phycomyces blakesleeanus]|uniref:White collar 2 protein n=1 Tax=Phycomyces blakesleeanus TaxID=4837 RepID=A0ABR3ATP9_PHYBL